ncbi:MAG: peptidase U32 family protein [Bacilli bacterium]
MKKELLSPAGNMKSLIAAINAGADAVYLGLKKYGARSFSNNFTHESFKDAITLAHIHNVKIYVTLNTIIFEDEIDSLLEEVRFLYINNVDAIILQDIGMIHLIREKFPDIEIHLSTQFHNHKFNKDLIDKLKINRIVVAREMGIDDINKIKDIEIEAFIHGSLCVSYSGQCYSSYLNGGRSGNRGACAQICRMKYSSNDNKINNEFILNTNDLCTIRHFDKILNSNVYSLKIEGRMKSPTYVYLVTKLYRTYIDHGYVDEEVYNMLTKEFNRGYTNGYLLNEKSIINKNTPNHIGVLVGEVIKVNKNKIKIKLLEDIFQNDGIKFKFVDKGMIINMLYKNDLLVNSGKKGDTIELDNKIGLTKKDKVYRTFDFNLSKLVNSIENKKVILNCEVTALIGKKLKIRYYNDYIDETIFGYIVLKAQNNEICESNIKNKLFKLGNTHFIGGNFKIVKDDNIFISLSSLNKLRRKLIEIIISNFSTLKNLNEKKYTFENIKTVPIQKINYTVANESQLLNLKNKNIGNIYTSDSNLYEKYEYMENLYYIIPRLNNSYISYKRTVSPDIYNIYGNDIVSDYFYNVTNSYSIYLLHKLGINLVTLSIEIRDIKLVLNEYKKRYGFLPTVEIIANGKLDAMIIKGKITEDKTKIKNIRKDEFDIILNKDFSIIKSKYKNNLVTKNNIDLDFSSIRYILEEKDVIK